MKENDNKYLDDFTKKAIKKTSLESPSFGFTSEIMSKVTELNTSNTTVYKPLISKKIWAVIAMSFIALCVYLILDTNTESSSWFSSLNFDALFDVKISNPLSGLAVSNTLLYAIAFFGLMFCIQIPFLKNYLDKRLEL